MKKTLFIILCILCLCWSAIQGQIVIGRVVNKTRTPLEGVSVALQTLDSTFAGGGITDTAGLFRIVVKLRPYRAMVSSIGFKSRVVSINTDNMGDIVLEEDSSVLKNVTVNGSRHIARLVNDRFVYDVDYILKEKVVSNAFDVVKEVPGIVSSDDNSLTISGLPHNSVIVNGRRTNLEGENLTNYLKSLPADRVKNVEIVYNATPEMRVSGPVINIVLKKNEITGFSGLSSGSWQNRHANSYDIRGSVFLDMKKWSFYTIYSFDDGRKRGRSYIENKHLLNDETYDINTSSRAKSHLQTHNIYSNIGYRPTNTTQIDLTYIGMVNPVVNATSETTSNLIANADSRNHGDSYWHDVQLSLTSSRVTGDVEYLRYKDKSEQNMQYARKNGFVDAFTYSSCQYVDKLRAGLSINNPIGQKAKFFYGLDYKYVKNNNLQSNLDKENNGKENYEVSSTNEEHTADGYLGFQMSLLNNRMTIYASLKDEWYKMKDYKHNTLIPYVVMSYAINANNYLQAFYTCTRNYPSYWSLQNYKFYSNEYEVSMGNPELRPATQNAWGLVYMWKGKYMLNTYYTVVNDFAITQSFQQPDKLQSLSKIFNIDFTSSWYLSLSAPVSVGKWFASNLSTSVYTERYKSNDWYGYAYDRNKWTVFMNAYNTFTISQKPKISVSLDVFYKSPSIQGIWDLSAYWSLNGGVKWQSANERFVVQLKVDDIFETGLADIKSRFETQWQNFYMNDYLRNITLSFTYKFKGYKDRQEKTVDTSRLGL